MSYPDEERAREAARRAFEEERARKRREIQKKIDELENEKTECEDMVSAFEGISGKITEAAEKLSGSLTLYRAPSSGLFAGKTQKAAEQGMEAASAAIGRTATAVEKVASAVDLQITQLKTYISELDNQIEELRRSM